MRRVLLPVLLPLLLLAAPAAAAAAQDLGIAVGASAPAAAVQTLDGRPADLRQYVGRTPVVLQFWATWCSSCKELEPAMTAAARRHGARVRFVAVAVSANQSAERVRRHLARTPMPGMEVVYDHDGNATDAYDVPATSYVVVLDRAGKVVYTGVGGTQDIEAALRRAGA